MHSLVIGSTKVTVPRTEVTLRNDFDTFVLHVFPHAVVHQMKCDRDDDRLRVDYAIRLNVNVQKPLQASDTNHDVHGTIEITGTMYYARHQKDAQTTLWVEDLTHPGTFDVSSVMDVRRQFIGFAAPKITVTQLHLIVTNIDQWRDEVIDIIQTALDEMLQLDDAVLKMLLQNQS